MMDGYPRTKRQMESFDDIMATKELTLDGIILIRVPDEVVITRLSGRRLDPETGRTYNLNFDGDTPAPEILARLQQRGDDRDDVVLKRLSIFHQETDAVIGHFASLKQLVLVDGTASPDAVFEDIVQQLESLTRAN